MEDKILNVLVRICEDEVVKENLDIELFENDLLDSLSFAELLVDIEDEFGIVISPSEINRDDLGTPNKIISLIKARS